MELYEAIQKRRTVRDFSTKRVPDDVLNRILEAGVKAPSHDHARDWHFVVLRDPKRIAEVLKHVNSGAEVQTRRTKRYVFRSKFCKKAYYGRKGKMYLESAEKLQVYKN